MKFTPVLALLLLSWTPTPSHGGYARPSLSGPRAIAMGGAFSPVADDVSALLWNPAGLASLDHQEVTATHANLFGSGIGNSYAALAIPVGVGRAVALDFHRAGFDDSELKFGENRIDLGVGVRLRSWLSLGAAAKYLSRSTDVDGIDEGRGHGTGFDLGVQVRPHPDLRFSLVTRDLGQTRLDYGTGRDVAVYPSTTALGAAWNFRRILLAAEAGDEWRLGSEVRILDEFRVRAGLREDSGDGEGPVSAVGFGMRWSGIQFDYAREMHPVLGSTNHFGVSLSFRFNPTLVRVENLHFDELYLSQYRRYGQHPPGTARLRNTGDEPLEVRLSLDLPGVTREPTEKTVILRPGVSTEIPLDLLLPPDVIGTRGDRRVQAGLSATYSSLRLPRTEVRKTGCLVYGAGAIDWSLGLEQAAAFLTTQDPVIETWARDVARNVFVEDREHFGNGNLALTCALFEGLNSIGATYLPDPDNPYSEVSGKRSVVDDVRYPRDTLARLSGDCDDLTILMASLQGNLGIETRFVDLPGHLMLLVDTGLHERQWPALALDPDLYVLAENRIWIPLETTLLGQDFLAAWQEGGRVFAGASLHGQPPLINLLAAREAYPPAVFDAGVSASPRRADSRRVEEEIVRIGTELTGMKQAYVKKNYPAFDNRPAPDPGRFNRLAHVAWLAGRHEKAIESLAGVPDDDVTWSAIHWNNTGLVLAAAGRVDEARSALSRALQSAPGDDVIIENNRILASGISSPQPSTQLQWKFRGER